MEQTVSRATQISNVISDVLTAYIQTVNFVVKDISIELAEFAVPVTSAVLFTVVDLIDDIFDLYPDEWALVERSIQRLNIWINNLIYNKVQGINQTLSRMSDITDLIIKALTDELIAIDESVTIRYNNRMFAIYGSITELSIAIDAPPSYLESIIQNARTFVLSVSCSAGLSYYDTLSGWDVELYRLLTVIKNSIPMYRTNPQRIKVDVENVLLRPLFEIYTNQQRDEVARIVTLEKTAIELLESVLENIILISGNTQAVKDLFVREVEPELAKIRDRLDWWFRDVYWPNQNNSRAALDSFHSKQIEVINSIKDVFTRLNLGGDIIDGINFLPDEQRADQLGKLVETSLTPIVTAGHEFTRQFKRKTAVPDDVKEQTELELNQPLFEVEEIPVPVSPVKERSKVSHPYYGGDF